MKIIGTQEELKWVRRALANNCEEFMARQIMFVSEEETKTTK